MAEKIYRVLAINPGSTSTKLAVYENEKVLAESTIRHTRDEIEACGSVLGQRDMREKYVAEMLAENAISPDSLDAIVGRGGLVEPIDSGTYEINKKMIEDLEGSAAAVHASALGGLVAISLGEKYGKKAYVVDPIVVDELEPYAKLTGLAGIERRSVFHALNTKSIARKAAKDLKLNYEDGRFVVAHMGGGITVGAHRYGRVIDVNDALAGEGPFTPERSGALPLLSVVEQCFSGEETYESMKDKITRSGGMQSYLGTNDMRQAEKMIKQGDEFAALVIDAMAYQVAKEIGAMVAALEGRVNAIILTGGLAYSVRFTASIKQRVDSIAPVLTYPGEDEMRALVDGALRVLSGEVSASIY